MTHRVRSPEAILLPASVVAVTLLLPLRGALESLPPVSFAATLVLFAAPGLLFCRWFLREHVSGVAALPVGFAISAGAFCLLGVPVLIAHRSLETYLWTTGVILALSLAAAAWRASRGEASVAEANNVPDRRPAGFMWAPFLLLGAGLALGGTRRVPTSYDDIWVYLSWVRDFTSSERVALREPYFGERTAELSRTHVNGWLLEQAALSRISGIDPIELVLDYLTPTLVIMALLAVYALARTLLKSERAAVLCGVVFALFHVAFIEPSVHNIGVELAARISEDKHAARFLILPVALLFAVLYVESRRRRYLGLFAFFCWAGIAVHPIVLPDIGLCMLGFGLGHVAANPGCRAAWTGMIALAVALWSVALGPALLMLAGRSPTAVLFAADINATPPKILANMVFVIKEWRHIHELADGSYIMHPWLILNPVILATYVLGVPFLLARAGRSPAAQLLLGGLAVTAVTVYLPPVATFVGENLVGPGLLWRLAWPIPLLALLTAGWMAWEGARYAGARWSAVSPGRGVIRLLPLALVTALVVVILSFYASKGVNLYQKHWKESVSGHHPDPVYPWLRENIRGPNVVLAPDRANTAIPAYTASVDVVSLRGAPVIRDREALERSAGSEIEVPKRALDVHRFFSGAGRQERYRILRRYRVDYLMVPADGPLDRQLQSEPPGFTSVDAPRERYALYAVSLRGLGAGAEPR